MVVARARRRRNAVALTLASALLGVGACGGGSDDARVGGPGASPGRSVLRVAYTREIDVLNALTSQNLVDIQFSMVEGLVTTTAASAALGLRLQAVGVESIEQQDALLALGCHRQQGRLFAAPLAPDDFAQLL